MSGFVRILAAIVLLVAASAPLAINSASARGAALSVMSSPGYQRALEESRKRYRQEVQPSTRPQPVHPRKTKRPRGHRH
ncbi:MAG: hypothetical protein J0G36_03775 [Afipia sp.]|nr:hypothetical protein [Afipia sp.]